MVKLILDASFALQDQKFRKSLDLLGGKLLFTTKKFSLSFRCINIIREGDVKFQQPSDVKVSDMLSLIFVSDTGTDRIMVFDLKTKKFIQSLTGITSPLMISFDSSDQRHIYFTTKRYEVGKYDIEQKRIIWLTSQGLTNPAGIVADNLNNGFLYVSDCSNNEIKCFAKRDGKLISAFGACQFPFGIDLNNDGDLVVSSLKTHTISVISKVLEKKQIYFSFGKKGIGLDEFQYPRGVFVESLSGYIYICDQSNSRIHVYDNFGNFIQSYGEAGTGNNNFKFPTGLCISKSRGELFVADTSNSVVKAFR